MSIWDDYKTRVRTRINVKQDRLLLTERQWKLSIMLSLTINAVSIYGLMLIVLIKSYIYGTRKYAK